MGTGHGRGVIAIGEDGIWVANGWSRTVAQLDPRTLELTALLGLGKVPVAVAVGTGAVWVLGGNGWLWRVRPEGPTVEGVARLGRRARAVAATGPWLWVLREHGELVRLDPETGTVTLEGNVGRGARNMVATDAAIWVTCRRGRKLLRIDPESAEVSAEMRLPQRAIRLEVEGRRLWVACGRWRSPKRGWLHAIDTDTMTVERSAEMDGEPRALTVGEGAVWAACAHRRRRQGVIERLDPDSDSLRPWVDTEWPVSGLIATAGSLLATMSLRLGGPIDGGTGVFDLGAAGGGDGGGGGGGHHG